MPEIEANGPSAEEVGGVELACALRLADALNDVRQHDGTVYCNSFGVAATVGGYTVQVDLSGEWVVVVA